MGRAGEERGRGAVGPGDDGGDVDFRDPTERFPVATLQKGSSKRHAIPGCATIRISEPGWFLDQGEGLAGNGESYHSANGWIFCASIEPEPSPSTSVENPSGFDDR